ncbi:MAG: hypothetical protein ABI896_01520 [Actinomycetota bacterium]
MSEHEQPRETEEEPDSEVEDLEVSDDDAEDVKGGGPQPHL